MKVPKDVAGRVHSSEFVMGDNEGEQIRAGLLPRNTIAVNQTPPFGDSGAGITIPLPYEPFHLFSPPTITFEEVKGGGGTTYWRVRAEWDPGQGNPTDNVRWILDHNCDWVQTITIEGIDIYIHCSAGKVGGDNDKPMSYEGTIPSSANRRRPIGPGSTYVDADKPDRVVLARSPTADRNPVEYNKSRMRSGRQIYLGVSIPRLWRHNAISPLGHLRFIDNVLNLSGRSAAALTERLQESLRAGEFGEELSSCVVNGIRVRALFRLYLVCDDNPIYQFSYRARRCFGMCANSFGAKKGGGGSDDSGKTVFDGPLSAGDVSAFAPVDQAAIAEYKAGGAGGSTGFVMRIVKDALPFPR